MPEDLRGKALAERLESLLAARRWSQNELSRQSKLSASYISELLSGESKRLTVETMTKLSAAFGESIFHDDVPSVHAESSTPAHPAPADFTMALPTSDGRRRGLLPSPYVIMQNVPVVLQRLAADNPDAHPESYADDPKELPVNVPRPGRYLAMRVQERDMVPDIEPGDFVILDQDETVRPDEVAAVELNGEQRLTRMLRRDEGEWEFAPDNPDLPALTVPPDGIPILGVVIARQKGAPTRPSPRRRPSP